MRNATHFVSHATELYYLRTVVIAYNIRTQERNDTKEERIKDIFLRIADFFYAYYTTPARLCNRRAQVQRFLAFYIR
jgi:hypothetical protein